MADKTNDLRIFLKDLADAIKEKTETTATEINPQDFSDLILSIEGGGGPTYDSDWSTIYAVTIEPDDNSSVDGAAPTAIYSGNHRIEIKFKVTTAGYSLPADTDIRVENATIRGWDRVSGILIVDNATGNVTITVKAVQGATLENGTYVFSNDADISTLSGTKLNFISNGINFDTITPGTTTSGDTTLNTMKYTDETVARMVDNKVVWEDDAFKTISVSETQTVTDAFYEWGIKNKNLTKQVIEPYTMNTTISEATSIFTQSFTSNNVAYNKMDYTTAEGMKYDDVTVFFHDSQKWKDESYRDVTFNGVITDEALKQYLLSNATPQLPKVFEINIDVENCEEDKGNNHTIVENETVYLKFVANDDCVLPSAVEINGAISSWNVNGNIGTLILSNPSSNITGTVSARKLIVYNITVNPSNIEGAADNPTTIVETKSATLRFKVTDTENYSFPSLEYIGVKGAAKSSLDEVEGTDWYALTISNPDSDVTINIRGVLSLMLVTAGTHQWNTTLPPIESITADFNFISNDTNFTAMTLGDSGVVSYTKSDGTIQPYSAEFRNFKFETAIGMPRKFYRYFVENSIATNEFSTYLFDSEIDNPVSETNIKFATAMPGSKYTAIACEEYSATGSTFPPKRYRMYFIEDSTRYKVYDNGTWYQNGSEAQAPELLRNITFQEVIPDDLRLWLSSVGFIYDDVVSAGTYDIAENLPYPESGYFSWTYSDIEFKSNGNSYVKMHIYTISQINLDGTITKGVGLGFIKEDGSEDIVHDIDGWSNAVFRKIEIANAVRTTNGFYRWFFNNTFKSIGDSWYARVSNLGAIKPSDVIFEKSDNFPTTWGEVTFNDDVFIKIPKIYRKVDSSENDQITGYTISNAKLDGNYALYPCFIDENNNELDYIYIGKYLCSSSTECNSVADEPFVLQNSKATARANASKKGDGYQLMDWRIQRLWQDLLLCSYGSVSIEIQTVSDDGSRSFDDKIGINWNLLSGATYYRQLIDGVRHQGTYYLYSNEPSKYGEASATTEGYYVCNIQAPQIFSNSLISRLCYDKKQPFFNYPSSIYSNYYKYDIYYCANYIYNGGSGAMAFSPASIYQSPFDCGLSNSTSEPNYAVRLCYRPIATQQTPETWLLNETGLNLSNVSGAPFTIDFSSEGISFTSIVPNNAELIYRNSDGDITAYGKVGWDLEGYRTIILSEPATGDLRTWLQANGSLNPVYVTPKYTFTYGENTSFITVGATGSSENSQQIIEKLSTYTGDLSTFISSELDIDLSTLLSNLGINENELNTQYGVNGNGDLEYPSSGALITVDDYSDKLLILYYANGLWKSSGLLSPIAGSSTTTYQWIPSVIGSVPVIFVVKRKGIIK